MNDTSTARAITAATEARLQIVNDTAATVDDRGAETRLEATLFALGCIYGARKVAAAATMLTHPSAARLVQKRLTS